MQICITMIFALIHEILAKNLLPGQPSSKHDFKGQYLKSCCDDIDDVINAKMVSF